MFKLNKGKIPGCYPETNISLSQACKYLTEISNSEHRSSEFYNEMQAPSLISKFGLCSLCRQGYKVYRRKQKF